MVGVAKRAQPQARARGQELEYLPFGMGGEPGPTAYRAVADPLARLAASNIRADAIAHIINEMRKPFFVPQNKRGTRKRVTQADLAGSGTVFF